MNSNKPSISTTGTALFLAVSSSAWISDAGAQAQYQPPAAQQQGQQAGGADIQVQQPAPQISVQQPAPQVQVQQPEPRVQVQQPAPRVQVQQPNPQVTVQQPSPQVTVQQPKPQVTVQQPAPQVTVKQAKPEVSVKEQGQPQVTVQEQGKPQVQVQQQGQPQVTVQEQGTPQAQVREGQPGAAVSSQSLAELQGGWRSTKLKGATLYNAQSQDIGKVRDLIISNDGQVSRVVLSVGDRTVQVPFKDLQISQSDHVVYSGTQPLDQQPTYIPPQGTQAQEGRVPPLVGRDVRDAQGNKVAEVDDLVIAPDGRVSLILSTGQTLGMGGKLVAVPFGSMQLTGQDYLLYNGNRDQLAQLPKFDYDQLKRSVGGATTGSTLEQRREGKTE